MKKELYKLVLDTKEDIVRVSKRLLEDPVCINDPLRLNFASDCVHAAGRLELLASTDWLDWFDADPIGTLENLVEHLTSLKEECYDC